MLTVLGGLAEFERELIKTRTGEGDDLTADRSLELHQKFYRDPRFPIRDRMRVAKECLPYESPTMVVSIDDRDGTFA
jgi:hypothetical protein